MVNWKKPRKITYSPREYKGASGVPPEEFCGWEPQNQQEHIRKLVAEKNHENYAAEALNLLKNTKEQALWGLISFSFKQNTGAYAKVEGFARAELERRKSKTEWCRVIVGFTIGGLVTVLVGEGVKSFF